MYVFRARGGWTRRRWRQENCDASPGEINAYSGERFVRVNNGRPAIMILPLSCPRKFRFVFAEFGDRVLPPSPIDSHPILFFVPFERVFRSKFFPLERKDLGMNLIGS